jgi:predicted Zn-dependent protease
MLKSKIVFLVVPFLFISLPSIFAQEKQEAGRASPQPAAVEEVKLREEVRSLFVKQELVKGAELLKNNKELAETVLLQFILSEGLSDFRDWVNFQYYNLAEKNAGIEKAIKKLEELSLKNPKSALLKTTIAEGYLRLKNMNKAVQIYEELNKANPNNQEIFLRLINLYMNQRNFLAVIKRLEPIVKEDPKHSAFTDILGYAYFGAGRKSDYSNLYKNIADKDKKSSESAIRYAQALMELGKKKEALKELERALKIDPSNILIREEIAQLYHELGNKKTAEKQLQEIKKIEPDYESEIFEQEASSINQEKGKVK